MVDGIAETGKIGQRASGGFLEGVGVSDGDLSVLRKIAELVDGGFSSCSADEADAIYHGQTFSDEVAAVGPCCDPSGPVGMAWSSSSP